MLLALQSARSLSNAGWIVASVLSLIMGPRIGIMIPGLRSSFAYVSRSRGCCFIALMPTSVQVKFPSRVRWGVIIFVSVVLEWRVRVPVVVFRFFVVVVGDRGWVVRLVCAAL